jgi:hypothetical protein
VRSIITSSSPTTYSPSAGGAATPSAATAASYASAAATASTAAAGSIPASSATPILTGSDWELDASTSGSTSTTIRITGGSSSDKAALSGSGSGTPAAAAAGVVEVVDDDYEQDVPPLDLGVLRGQAVLPGNAGLLLQAGEQRR